MPQPENLAVHDDGVAMTADNLSPPAVLLALTEAQRSAIEATIGMLGRRLLDRAPRGDGHPVMVVPGFLGSDGYTASLRRYLTRLGYAVHGWGQGRNLGPRDGALDRLRERLDYLHSRYGARLSLVGHSLGGIYARELAREAPALVRQVISLGTPFAEGRRSGSYPSRLFERLNPDDELPLGEGALHVPPPVPTSAVYSRGDGVVNWRTSLHGVHAGHGAVEDIRVPGSHCGMAVNPLVWLVIADRLGQREGSWQPFSMRTLYALALGLRR